jgi:hypothetical protein
MVAPLIIGKHETFVVLICSLGFIRQKLVPFQSSGERSKTP